MLRSNFTLVGLPLLARLEEFSKATHRLSHSLRHACRDITVQSTRAVRDLHERPVNPAEGGR